MELELDDPLKPLAAIFDPDERQAFMVGTLTELHQELSTLELSRLVPKEVRQLFETAKNVRLYAFFAFRLHQVAEMGFYQSLEMALRSRRLIEDHNGAALQSSKAGKRLNLGGLLKEAAACGWIYNAGFSMRSLRAKNALVHEKTVEAIERARAVGHEGDIAVSEPTEEEIAARAQIIDVTALMCKHIPQFRNELAHGSIKLYPHGMMIYRDICDAINMLFVKPK
jgi:hypothetical protein